MSVVSDIDIKDELLFPSSDDNEVGFARFVYIFILSLFCNLIVFKYTLNTYLYVCL